MWLIFSHALTSEQMEDAKVSFGVTDFVSLPPELQKEWSNIPPDLSNLENYLDKLTKYLKNNVKKDDIVLIQGDYGATFKVVNLVSALGATPVYATTKRVAVEEKIGGEISKRSVFKHVMFRQY